MITTYEFYKEQKAKGNVIDRGYIKDNFERYFCYDLIDEQETCHYPAEEENEKDNEKN